MYWINIEYFNNKDNETHLYKSNLSGYAEGLENNNEEVSKALLSSLCRINNLLKDKNNSVLNITISEEEFDTELKKIREWDSNKMTQECSTKDETKEQNTVPNM